MLKSSEYIHINLTCDVLWIYRELPYVKINKQTKQIYINSHFGKHCWTDFFKANQKNYGRQSVLKQYWNPVFLIITLSLYFTKCWLVVFWPQHAARHWGVIRLFLLYLILPSWFLALESGCRAMKSSPIATRLEYIYRARKGVKTHRISKKRKGSVKRRQGQSQSNINTLKVILTLQPPWQPVVIFRRRRLNLFLDFWNFTWIWYNSCKWEVRNSAS